MTCAEAGRRGGATTVRRYGVKHMRKIGRLGGKHTRTDAAAQAWKEREELYRGKQGRKEFAAEFPEATLAGTSGTALPFIESEESNA